MHVVVLDSFNDEYNCCGYVVKKRNGRLIMNTIVRTGMVLDMVMTYSKIPCIFLSSSCFSYFLTTGQ
jgi:hypothetical protein